MSKIISIMLPKVLQGKLGQRVASRETTADQIVAVSHFCYKALERKIPKEEYSAKVLRAKVPQCFDHSGHITELGVDIFERSNQRLNLPNEATFRDRIVQIISLYSTRVEDNAKLAKTR